MKQLTRQCVLASLQEKKGLLRDRFSVQRIGLFGSRVRGDDTSGSDIDVLVDLGEPTFDHYMELKLYLEDLFGCPVDVVMTSALRPHLRERILGEVKYAA